MFEATFKAEMADSTADLWSPFRSFAFEREIKRWKFLGSFVSAVSSAIIASSKLDIRLIVSLFSEIDSVCVSSDTIKCVLGAVIDGVPDILMSGSAIAMYLPDACPRLFRINEHNFIIFASANSSRSMSFNW